MKVNAMERPRLLPDVQMGSGVGLLLGGVVWLGGVVLTLAAGYRPNTGWLSAMGACLLGGALGGFLVGLFLPIRKRFFGRLALGVIGVLPFYVLVVGVLIAGGPEASIDGEYAPGIVLMSTVILAVAAGVVGRAQSTPHLEWSRYRRLAYYLSGVLSVIFVVDAAFMTVWLPVANDSPLALWAYGTYIMMPLYLPALTVSLGLVLVYLLTRWRIGWIIQRREWIFGAAVVGSFASKFLLHFLAG